MGTIYERMLASLRSVTKFLGSIFLYAFCVVWIPIAIWSIVESWDPMVQQAVIEGEVDPRILFRAATAMFYIMVIAGHGIVIYYAYQWARQCRLDAKVR
jgi:hypothetical protein